MLVARLFSLKYGRERWILLRNRLWRLDYLTHTPALIASSHWIRNGIYADLTKVKRMYTYTFMFSCDFIIPVLIKIYKLWAGYLNEFYISHFDLLRSVPFRIDKCSVSLCNIRSCYFLQLNSEIDLDGDFVKLSLKTSTGPTRLKPHNKPARWTLRDNAMTRCREYAYIGPNSSVLSGFQLSICFITLCELAGSKLAPLSQPKRSKAKIIPAWVPTYFKALCSGCMSLLPNSCGKKWNPCSNSEQNYEKEGW